MKKIILTITVAAFTLGAFAGTKDAADSCCAKVKATECTSSTSKDNAACTASTTAGKKCTKCAGKKVVHSPKGAAAAGKS